MQIFLDIFIRCDLRKSQSLARNDELIFLYEMHFTSINTVFCGFDDYAQKQNNRNKIQVYLMTVLCVGEIGFLIFGAFLNRSRSCILELLQLIGICNIFLVVVCYSAMALFTIDRFLVFHMNIRY